MFMKYVLATLRLIVFLLGTIVHTLVVSTVVLVGGSPKARMRVQQSWSRFMIWSLGIQIEWQGNVPTESALFVPNHRSYSDICFIPSKIICTIVAKQELRSWPIIGFAAEKAMVVFVSRKDVQSRIQTREEMRNRLLNGLSVMVFPEGTTIREGVKEFRRGMFDVAAEGEIPVVPVAIEYENQDVAWVGNDTFVPHFMRIFGSLRQRVKIRIGPTLRGQDGKELCATAHQWVNNACQEMRAEWAK